MEGNPLHLGVVSSFSKGVIIESSGGRFERVFRHPVWNVPTSYGNQIFYYKPFTADQALKCFKEYCILKRQEADSKIEELLAQYAKRSDSISSSHFTGQS